MTSKKVAIFLSIRDKSTRLPAKVRRIIHGQSVTEHLIDRLKLSQKADQIIMATSNNPQDAWLVSIAEKKGIGCFRGDEEDKLKRYLDAADFHNIDFIVVVDGDDLFSDWHFIDEIINRFQQFNEDYIICDKLPLGVTGFGVKVEALRIVVKNKKEKNTEVWGGFFVNTKQFVPYFIQVPTEFQRPDYRMTLDYPEDLQLFEKIYDYLYKGEPILLRDIINLLDTNPHLTEINSEAQKRYELNLAAPKKLVDVDTANWS